MLISNIQFHLYLQDFVQSKEFGVIPQDTNCQYVYAPKPAEKIPPLGSDEAYHYFSNPACLGNQQSPREHIDRLPKKLTRLNTRNDDAWGICCVDALSYVYVLILLGFFVLAGCMFGIVWAVNFKDLQGGMAITQVILAIGAGVVALFALRITKV